MPRRADGPALVRPLDARRDHVHGSSVASTTLVEYGDYECPHCRRAHGIVAGVLEELGDEVLFAYRHFPLAEAHPHAKRAAEAAEAAGAQGRFWEMHDLLFENQDELGDRFFAAAARSLGLDVDRFVHEIATGVHEARVREDFLDGIRSGVNGTPTFFVDGRRFDGPWERDELVRVLRAREGARPKAR